MPASNPECGQQLCILSHWKGKGGQIEKELEGITVTGGNLKRGENK